MYDIYIIEIKLEYILSCLISSIFLKNLWIRGNYNATYDVHIVQVKLEYVL